MSMTAGKTDAEKSADEREALRDEIGRLQALLVVNSKAVRILAEKLAETSPFAADYWIDHAKTKAREVVS